MAYIYKQLENVGELLKFCAKLTTCRADEFKTILYLTVRQSHTMANLLYFLNIQEIKISFHRGFHVTRGKSF